MVCWLRFAKGAVVTRVFREMRAMLKMPDSPLAS
jgi:hypothetical protein